MAASIPGTVETAPAIASPVGNENLDSPSIVLLPWDPDSVEHVERLKQQRIACGWKLEAVEGWKTLQRDGKIGMHWIVSPTGEISNCPVFIKRKTQSHESVTITR